MAIKMSPDELRACVQKLNSLCLSAQNLARDIDREINAAANNWEGQSRDRYLKDWEHLKPTMNEKIPEQLDTMARNLKTMADEMEALDKKFGNS